MMYHAALTFAVACFLRLHSLPWAAVLANACCRPLSVRSQESLGLFFTFSSARSGCFVASLLCRSSDVRHLTLQATSSSMRWCSHCPASPPPRARIACLGTSVVADDTCFVFVLLVFGFLFPFAKFANETQLKRVGAICHYELL